jgi:hypothetical protein
MRVSTVRRDTSAQTYRIRVDYEWATIVLFGWQATGNDDTPRECGEILINSSFGQWAHGWGHMGVPLKAFLLDIDRGYAAGKFLGSAALKFDGNLTVRQLQMRLLSWRKEGQLDRYEARQVWDYIEASEDELKCSANDFVNAMQYGQTELIPTKAVRRFLQEPWELLASSIDIQFAGFWREIWPVFLEQLRSEQGVTA